MQWFQPKMTLLNGKGLTHLKWSHFRLKPFHENHVNLFK